jgi:hypothetical protein
VNVQQAPAVAEMMAWEARAITALWPAAAAFARREPREAVARETVARETVARETVARDVRAFREHPAGAYTLAMFRTERRG